MYSAIQYSPFGTALSSPELNCTLLYSIILHCTVTYCILLCSTLCSTHVFTLLPNYSVLLCLTLLNFSCTLVSCTVLRSTLVLCTVLRQPHFHCMGRPPSARACYTLLYSTFVFHPTSVHYCIPLNSSALYSALLCSATVYTLLCLMYSALFCRTQLVFYSIQYFSPLCCTTTALAQTLNWESSTVFLMYSLYFRCIMGLNH